MTTELTTLTNQHADFYRLLGPYLGSREVHKQVGGAIYDDDGKTWIVATDDGQVTGFIGILSGGRAGRGMAVAESCYLADEGDSALLAILIRAAVATAAPTPVRATVRKDREAAYTSAGFTVAGATKGYVKLIHSVRSGRHLRSVARKAQS